MQRQSFPPPNPKSPELFHPRPQHISQVPHLRSPPPPVQPQQHPPPVNSYGNPYGSPPIQQAGVDPAYGGNFFGGFMNDPTAQMASQIGKSAVMSGQHYVEQNVRARIHRKRGELTRDSLVDTSLCPPGSITSMSRTLMLSENYFSCSSLGDTSLGVDSNHD